MVMSRDQNAEISNNIQTDNSSFERMGECEYMKSVNKSKFCLGRR